MNEELKIIITAEIDKLKKELEEGQKEVRKLADEAKSSDSKFGKAMKSIGKAAAMGMATVTAAVAAGAGALIGLSESTKEYRTEQAKLNSAFEAAGSSAEQAKTTYNELYRVLGESDVAVEAANHLAKLTTNEQDLAEWTDICQGVYATFGDSLPIEGLTEAANETAKVGTVTGSLADALNWAGVSEDEFNAKLEACNTEAEREALIRETLNGLYKDAADAYEENAASLIRANEAQERMTSALAALGEVAEPIVTEMKILAASLLESLVPGLQLVSEGLNDMINGLDGGAEKMSEGISMMIESLLTKITEALPTLLSVGIEIVMSLLQGIMEALPSVVNTIISLLPTVISQILAMLPQLLELGVQLISTILQGIAQMLPSIITAIVELIPQIVNVLVENIPVLLEAAINLVMTIVKAIPEIIPSLIEELLLLIDGLLGTIIENIPVLLEAAIEFLMAIVNAIPEIIPPIIEKLPILIDQILTMIVENIPVLLDAAIELFTALVDAIPEIIPALVEAIPDIIDSVIDAIIEAIPEILKAAVKLFMAIVDAIPEIIPDLINGLGDIVSTVTTNLINKLLDLMGFDWELPKIKVPHFSVKPEGWKIGDLLKGSIPKLGISWYAEGGVFDEPTLFSSGGNLGGLGENGAEAVVPLENNLEWLDKIASMLADRLGGGNRPIILQVDGKTFARTSIDTINQLTKQTGSLDLVIA